MDTEKDAGLIVNDDGGSAHRADMAIIRGGERGHDAELFSPRVIHDGVGQLDGILQAEIFLKDAIFRGSGIVPRSTGALPPSAGVADSTHGDRAAGEGAGGPDD